MMKKIRMLISNLYHFIIITYYKLNGPPELLRFGMHLNVKILRTFGASIGNNVRIQPPLKLTPVWKQNGYYAHLTIEDDVFISGDNYFDIPAPITIKKGASIGPGVTILTHNNYNQNSYLNERLAHTCGQTQVVIGEGASIKAHAVITMGVTIGKEAVIAAGAVVTQDVREQTLVGGIPARLIRDLNEK